MATGSVFINNRAQAVRLPAEARFPDSVKRVEVRIMGSERVIAPVGSAWDSFFLEERGPTADFIEDRATQDEADREAF